MKKMRWVEEGIYRTSPKAKYSIDIVMPNSDGTSKRIRRRISRDLKETRKELYNLRDKREKGIRGVPDMSVTFKEIIAQFGEHSKANAFKPGSIRRDEDVFKTIEQYFGPDTKLIALTFEKIEAYIIKRRSEGAKQGTIRLEFGTIRKLLNLAIKSNYLQKNPCRDMKLRKAMPGKNSRFFTTVELAKIISDKLIVTGKKFQAFVMILMYVGVRTGEAIRLYWSDIDFANMIIYIKEHREIEWTPKDYERRIIPLKPELYRILKALKNPNDTGPIFLKNIPSHTDTMLSYIENFKRGQGRRVTRLFRRNRIPNASPHTFRHNFASHASNDGIPIGVIQKWLGHSDIKTTLNYIHTISSDEKTQMAKTNMGVKL